MVGLAEEIYNDGKADANRNAAIGFLKQGVDISLIAKVLGFTQEEIQAIAADQQN